MPHDLSLQEFCCACGKQLVLAAEVVARPNGVDLQPKAIQPNAVHCELCEKFSCVDCQRENICLRCRHEDIDKDVA